MLFAVKSSPSPMVLRLSDLTSTEHSISTQSSKKKTNKTQNINLLPTKKNFTITHSGLSVENAALVSSFLHLTQNLNPHPPFQKTLLISSTHLDILLLQSLTRQN